MKEGASGFIWLKEQKTISAAESVPNQLEIINLYEAGTSKRVKGVNWDGGREFKNEQAN